MRAGEYLVRNVIEFGSPPVLFQGAGHRPPNKGNKSAKPLKAGGRLDGAWRFGQRQGRVTLCIVGLRHRLFWRNPHRPKHDRSAAANA